MVLELNDVYHPEFVKYYEFNIYLAFILTNLLFPPIIYIVLTQSKNAKMYKYLLINQLFWSYLHVLVFTIWIHISVFPISAIYFRGLGTIFGAHAFMVHLPAHLLVSVGHTQSYLIAGLYRLSYATGDTTTKIQHLFRSKTKLLCLVVGSWIFFSIPVAGPCLFGNYEIWRHTQLPKSPILQELVKLEPTVTAYPFFGFADADLAIAISLIAYAIFIFVFFIAGSAVFFNFIYDTFAKMKQFMSKPTYKIHMILFLALTIQLTTVTVLLFVPFFIQYMVYWLQLEKGSYLAVSMFIPMNYHLAIEIIALGVFVKPYREFLLKLWKEKSPVKLIRSQTSSSGENHTTNKTNSQRSSSEGENKTEQKTLSSK